MNLPETLKISTILLLGTIIFFSVLFIVGFSYLKLPHAVRTLTHHFWGGEAHAIYLEVFAPARTWIALSFVAIGFDLMLLANVEYHWIEVLEIPVGAIVAINLSFLGFNLFDRLYDSQLLEAALENGEKINSELLVLAKFISNAIIVLIVIFIFAQAHQINLFGLLASLGIGGVAIALASQKVLEQILWSIVLYIDRPFSVDDYIHLPDSTLGRVESIGWRSTKIRLSGKNTLVIVPNSLLAQTSIENMTRSRRVISIANLILLRDVSEEERAFIEQLIFESTRDILGIDPRFTQVRFELATDASGQKYVKAKLIFYILGAAESSMELRKNLLEIAKDKIIEDLDKYNIKFSFEETTIDITQPMNI
ncbi:MAG: mechanosensitive ion channel [Cyanobacteriota bacterium]|nr:mechanosensitive ion channel [Cyanobacteriota bacterium]